MALAQRFTNTGVLQTAGNIVEDSLNIEPIVVLSTSNTPHAIAAYPTAITGTGLTNTGNGTFNWTCPAGVTSVCVVAVGAGGLGGGGGGGGGGLGWKNNITVVPGTVYTVVAGAPGTSSNASGGDSYFISSATVKGGGGSNGIGVGAGTGAGGTYTGDGGGNGGAGSASTSWGGGGGGAGGYSGAGGDGGNSSGASLPSGNGSNGSGGGGGGGSAHSNVDSNDVKRKGGGGGGVGVFGQGSNGAGAISTNFGGDPGSGGSGGSNGVQGDSSNGGAGGAYGGGGGGSNATNGTFSNTPGVGAVRIIWGSGRSFPTNSEFASGITNHTPTRLFQNGNFFITGTFDEYTLPTTYSYTYSDTAAYSVLFNPNRSAQLFNVKTSGGNGLALNAKSNAWTIEFWFKSSAYTDTGGNSQWILDCYNGSTFAFFLGFQGSDTFQIYQTGYGNVNTGTITPYTLNQWNHFALVSNIGLTLYINGVAQSGFTGITNNIVSDGNATNVNQFVIGGGAFGAGASNWYFSQLRVNNSTAVYTGNFTPPSRLSATQYPGTNINAINGGTMLLTCNSSSFVDQSTNSLTLTPYSNTTPLPSISSSQYPTFSLDSVYNPPGGRTLNGTLAMRKQTASLYQVYDSFDEVSLAYTITPDKKIVNEGDTVTYTINAPLLGNGTGTGTMYYTNVGSTAAADFTGGIVYGVTPLTWAGTATATLWSFTGITQLSTSGFGTGAVFSIRKNNATTTMGTFGVLTVIPTSPGAGYTIGDTIVIDGASLGLTTTTNNLTITVGSDWFAQVIYSATITGTGMVTSGTGTANWTCPDGVYRISVAAVGGGGGGGSGAGASGGGGGACGYITDVAVIPGTVYSVVVGAGGVSGGGTSSFQDPNSGTLLNCTGGDGGGTLGNGPGIGGTVTIGTGFAGGGGGIGSSSPAAQGGGGGAGGLTAAGGSGGTAFGVFLNLSIQSGKNSTSGGGGGSSGGGAGILDSVGTAVNTSTGNGGGGGGVLLLGVSNLGLGGANLAGSTGAIIGQSGTGGSGGATGGAASATVGGAGGALGGGGGAGSTTGGAGGAGALRIIWNYPPGFLPSTTALTAVTNTKLLTAQSATITDVTSINTITNIANVTAGNTTIPFAGTYSYQFNGTTQYLTVPSSSNFIFNATDEFTIELWVYPTATTINKGIFFRRNSLYSGIGFGTSTTTAGKWRFFVANADGTNSIINDLAIGTFTINTWFHIAISKKNGVIYLYINGLLIRQYAHTTSIYDDGLPLYIGTDPNGAFFVGYISNFRIIKGTALYYPPSTIVNRNYPDYPYVVQNSGAISIVDSSYTTPGTYSWTCPQGVTSINAICVGGGGAGNAGAGSGGGGGGLGYKNNITVIPGTTYTIVVGAGGAENTTGSVNPGGDSYFISTSTVKGGGGGGGISAAGVAIVAGGAGGTYVGDAGGNGGAGGAANYTMSGAGGGAGGYAGNGGAGAAGVYDVASAGGNPAVGSGAAGGGSNGIDHPYGYSYAAGGGGVGILGVGSIGTGGAADPGFITTGQGGIGGSGGTNGGIATGDISPYGGLTGTGRGGIGGTYGGGGGGGQSGGGAGGSGAVRIYTTNPRTLALTVGQDILQEGVQDIQLQLRSGSTSGTVLATAPTVVVADTSRPLALPGGGQCWCAYPDYVSGPNLVYTGTPGVFTFTAPKGYTAVSAVAIGGGGAGGDNGGGGGGGGALAYSAAITVVAGTTYTITCGAGGTSMNAGTASSFASTVIANGGQPGGTYSSPTGGAGGTVGAGTGFAGGAGGTGVGTISGGGGGGAGGYTVVGGVGGTFTGTYPTTLVAGSGAASATGGAGGSAGGSATAGGYIGPGGGGGGTSPFGSVAVASIAGTSLAGTQNNAGRGGGGSGGNPTTTASGVQLGERGYTANVNVAGQTPNGGRFGGGGGGGDGGNPGGASGSGGPGCVRIIWGTGRAYPATLTADRVSGYPAAAGNPAGQQ